MSKRIIPLLVNEPLKLTVSLIDSENATCGNINGTATVSASGGSGTTHLAGTIVWRCIY
ncbi:MAG: hypothetical protein M3512_07735 [Bacteroidota bacterium]|nr:hypothetical protein [Bacteroidota bacterium]